jgi:hypothetical protein
VSAAEQVHYCRVPLPESNEWGGNLFATRLAIREVLTTLERTGVDPAAGQLRVTYDMDSELLTTYVAAEWRPNK